MDIMDIMTNDLKQRKRQLLDENEQLIQSYQNAPNNLDLLYKILENNIRLDELNKFSLRVLTSMIG